MRICLFSFSLIFFQCTHGSIGNSMTERMIAWNRLVSIVNTQSSSVITSIYLIDDQGDNQPYSFSLNSSSILYTITLNRSSQILFNSYALYLGKGNDLLAKNITKHIGEPIITTENSTSLTERYYNNNISNSILLSNTSLITDDLGYLYQSNLSESLKIPRGNISSFVTTMGMNLNGSISNGTTNVTFSINLSPTQFNSSFSCPIYHDGFGETTIKIKLKLVEILSDSGSSKPLHTLFLNGNVNTSIQQAFQSNFNSSSLLEQYSCIKK